MIPRTRPQDTDRQGDWRQELRQAITEPEELLQILRLPKSRWLAGARQAARQFSLKVPRSFVTRMTPGDPQDPLLRQVLPLADETYHVDGCHQDPVEDTASTCEPGLIQKYAGRTLMITTGACAIHCRYCFRRHFPYSRSHTGGRNLDRALSAIQVDTSLSEVILSGGDPLMLDDQQLANILSQIDRFPHIERIRIHTRLPVVLPARIDHSFVTILDKAKKTVTLVIHCNHPNEINNEVSLALSMLHNAGIRLYNQSVLLRGVNNHAGTLVQLCKDLFECHVQPYYLHLLDPVQGAAHFDVPEQEAITIYRETKKQLPGYLLPQLVREIPGESAKTAINV